MSAIFNENIQYIDPTTGELLVNGYIYIGVDGLDAELNPITIYSDRELTIVLPNPQRTGSDGRSVNKIWVPGRHSMKIQDSDNVQKLNDLFMGDFSQTGNTNLTNVIGVDAVTAQASPTVTLLIDKQVYIFTAVGANTGAMTLGIDSTPVLPIRRRQTEAMIAGDIRTDQVVMVVYNETDSIYEMISFTANEVVPGRLNLGVGNVGPTYLQITNTALGETPSNGSELQVDTSGDLYITNQENADIILSTNGSNKRVRIGNTYVDLTGVAINEARWPDIASATLTDIGAATGNYGDITGSATITGLGVTQAGASRVCHFTSTPTLTHNATSLILPGGVDIPVLSGDIATFRSLGGGNWRCTNYSRSSVLYKGASVYITGTQTLTDSLFTSLEWDTIDHDVGGFFSAGNNVVFTIPVGVGFIELNCTTKFTANPTGIRQIYFTKNGISFYNGAQMLLNGNVSPSALGLPISTGPISVVAGDVFGVTAYQTSGGNLSVLGWSAGSTSFSIKAVG